MKKIFIFRHWLIILIYAVICAILTGIGMGVPILNILSGFLIGWYAVIRASLLYGSLKQRMSRIIIYCLIASGITMLFMFAIWGRSTLLMSDPLFDYGNFGHPMILYEPRASFIGWLVLMIFISPVLQLLASISSAFLTLRSRL